jgi:hypothetical protein
VGRKQGLKWDITASFEKSAYSRSLLPYGRSLLTLVWSTQALVVQFHSLQIAEENRLLGRERTRGVSSLGIEKVEVEERSSAS